MEKPNFKLYPDEAYINKQEEHTEQKESQAGFNFQSLLPLMSMMNGGGDMSSILSLLGGNKTDPANNQMAGMMELFKNMPQKTTPPKEEEVIDMPKMTKVKDYYN